ncbi:Cytochrome P468 monooxygenase [Paramyrothecium foliicola]|nr:Cytochrome P468 monooxygenase [Paramyrothecium foliicola]
MSGEQLTPVPDPLAHPVLGNLLHLDRESTIESFVELAASIDPFTSYVLAVQNGFLSLGMNLSMSYALVRTLSRYPQESFVLWKKLTPEDLFTVGYGQDSWELAHRIIIPAIGHLPVRKMFTGKCSNMSRLDVHGRYSTHGMLLTSAEAL